MDALNGKRPHWFYIVDDYVSDVAFGGREARGAGARAEARGAMSGYEHHQTKSSVAYLQATVVCATSESLPALVPGAGS